MTNILAKIAPYRKTVVLIVGVLVYAFGTHFGGNVYFQAVVDILTILGVYQVPNEPLPITE